MGKSVILQSLRLMEGVKGLSEGIRRDGDGFDIDFSEDRPDDLMKLLDIETRAPRQRSDGITHYSPFVFHGDQADISDLRAALKSMDVDRLRGMHNGEYAFEVLLDEGARRFVAKTGVSKFAAAITPQPIGGPSPLSNLLLSSLQQVASIGVSIHGGVVKSALEDVGVDEVALKASLLRLYGDETKVEQYSRDVMRQVERAKRSGTFRMKDVVPNWRKFVRGFLRLSDKRLEEALVKSPLPVVFIDDYNTTGATVAEAARLIRELDPNRAIYSYTLCRSYSAS